MKGIIKKIIIFVVVLAILIALFNILFRFLLPIKPIKLNSNSMVPTYNKGDILFYKSSENYNVGDVILFTPAHSYPITHRIVNVSTDEKGLYFSAKGDGNLGQLDLEKVIYPNQISGKVIFSMNFYLFYILSYCIQILIAILATWLVSRKKD